MKNWTQLFELSRGGATNNFRPMEGLRGFAVFLVFLVHYTTLASPWIGQGTSADLLANVLHTVGNVGVDLFFVLSGYLIYGSLIARPQPFRAFISRRIRRIYPAFLAVFVAYVLLSFVFPQESKIPASVPQGVLYLLQNLLLLPGIFPIDPLITVAWSLSYEMLYYLAIPLVIGLLRLRSRDRIWRVVFFSLVAVAILVVFAGLGSSHIRLAMFVAGILLYETLDGHWAAAPGSTFGFLVLGTGMFATLLPLYGASGMAIKTIALFVAFYVVCLTCYRRPTGWLARTFTWAPLRWLGNMSYSYYLLHGLALKAGFMLFSRAVPSAPFDSWLFFVLLPPMFVATLIPSAALFLAIERPYSLAPRRAKHPAVQPQSQLP